jgi:hypothetical protein
MNGSSNPGRRRRRVAVDAAMVFVIILLMTQMWLLTATLESYLAGHKDAAFPGLLMSAGIFAVCAWLYRLVVRLDRLPEAPHDRSAAGPWRVGADARTDR